MAARRQDHPRREGVIDGVGQSPRICRTLDIIKRDVCRRDVLQLDVLVNGIVFSKVTRAEIRRMVMNFAEYDGPDQRSGVRPAQSRGPLWRELVTASAGDIAAKGTPIFSGAEVEALIISSQLFREWVGREQIHFFAQRAERERPRACVELCLVKDQKAARGNKAAVRHAELAGLIKIVGDKPAA